MEPTEPASSAPTPARAQLAYGREPDTRRRRWFKRWLKRFAIGVSVLILVVLTAHAVWLYVEARRLTTAWAALRAAGEPTTLAEISPAAVPDDQNGFDAINDIGTLATATTPASRRLDMLAPIRLPLTTLERVRLTERQQELAAIWPRLDEALAKPHLVSTTPLTSPLIGMNLPRFNLMREVANTLAAAAILAHDAGRHDEALRRLTQLDRLADAPASIPTLVGTLVSIGIRALENDRLGEITPTLRIGDHPGDASPADVRKTIDRLLDTRSIDAATLFTLRGERFGAADTLDAISSGRYGSNASGLAYRVLSAMQRYAMRPLFKSNAVRTIDTTSIAIQAAAAPDYQSAIARLGSASSPPSGIKRYTQFLSSLLTPSYQRSIEVLFTVKTERHFAAIALACRWFEIDHGRLPTKLDELVPKYLPAVPTDLFAATPTPLRAKLDGTDPVIWSVGKNGVDDGGPASATAAYSMWSNLDAVFHLRPQPRQFSPDMQRMMTLDPDARIRTSTATTQPVRPPAEPAAGVVPPDWDQVDSIDVDGDPAALGFDRRRDVLSWLADAATAAPTEDEKPATRPTTQPVGYVWGTALVAGRPWRFTIGSDGVGVLTADNGEQIFLWKTAAPYPSEAGRRLWR